MSLVCIPKKKSEKPFGLSAPKAQTQEIVACFGQALESITILAWSNQL